MGEISVAKILAQVAEVVKRCPHFGDWDEYCNLNCDLYQFCDGIYMSQDGSKIEKV